MYIWRHDILRSRRYSRKGETVGYSQPCFYSPIAEAIAVTTESSPHLSTGLLLLLLEEGKETDTGHLGDLEADTGNVTLGVAGTTETSDEHLVLSGLAVR